MSINVTAFILTPSLRPPTPPPLHRRPRTSPIFHPHPSIRPHRNTRIHPHRLRTLALAENPDSDITPSPTPSDLDAPGFALTDLPTFPFKDLAANEHLFQRGGAYAIRDNQGTVCYMGYSKNVAAKLAFHRDLVPDKCVRFQLYVPPVPQELVSPEVLENVLEFWVRENGAVPSGNTVDRALWERPVDRKNNAQKSQGSRTSNVASEGRQKQTDIPVRERATTPRRSSRRERPTQVNVDPFADNFRSPTGATSRRKRKNTNAASWEPLDDDYVELDVDPLDPFSASKKRTSTRGAWDFQQDDDAADEDWMPIVAIMGCAGLIWLFGLLSNALPAATPSLGM